MLKDSQAKTTEIIPSDKIYNFFFISSSGKQAAIPRQSVTVTKQAAIGDGCDGC